MASLTQTLTGLLDLAQDAFTGNDSGNAPVLLMLGTFKFSLNTAVFTEQNRTTGFTWGDKERFGQLAALQFTGPGEDRMTLPGIVYPDFKGGDRQLDDLRSLASEGQPQQLIDSGGSVLGMWVIESVEEKQSFWKPDGTFRKQEFNVALRRFS